MPSHTRRVRSRVQSKLAQVKAKLVDAVQYRETLNFMFERVKAEQITFNTTMKAYEDLLRVRSQEAAQSKLVLAEVRGARDTELHELDRLQRMVEKRKAAMEKKLEERRTTAAQR